MTMIALTDYQLARLREIQKANDAKFLGAYLPTTVTSTDLALINFDYAVLVAGRWGGMKITDKGRKYLDELAI